MEDQVIVFELPGGEIRYSVCPAKMKKPGETTPEWLLRVFNKTVRDNFPGAKRINNAAMPDGQPFRPGAQKLFYDAWRSDGAGNIQIDMSVAREIRMNEIRAARNRKLEESDKEWLRILDLGTSNQQIRFKVYRQALRDIPQGIDMSTLNEAESLEAFQPNWPAIPQDS